MAEITVTFDPQDITLMTDIAKEVGVGLTVARTWVLRRLADTNSPIPRPLFTLAVGNNNSMMVWSPKDGRKIVAAYRAQREATAEQAKAPANEELIDVS